MINGKNSTKMFYSNSATYLNNYVIRSYSIKTMVILVCDVRTCVRLFIKVVFPYISAWSLESYGNLLSSET